MRKRSRSNLFGTNFRVPGHIRGGSFEYCQFIHEFGFRRGPLDAAGFADWPIHAVQRLSPAAFARVDRLLRPGIVAHTDCSGRFTPECALKFLIKAMQSCGAPKYHMGVLQPWRACDLSTLSRRIMLMDTPCKARHVFKSMLDKLPGEVASKISDMRPAGSDT